MKSIDVHDDNVLERVGNLINFMVDGVCSPFNVYTMSKVTYFLSKYKGMKKS